MKRLTPIFLILALSLPVVKSHAQISIWKSIQADRIPIQEGRAIIPDQFLAFDLDIQQLQSSLENTPFEYNPENESLSIFLPNPAGGFDSYQIVESPVMEPGLASRYPMIKTYRGWSSEKKPVSMRLDLSQKGLNALILSPEGNFYISPYSNESNQYHMAYWVKDAGAWREQEAGAQACSVTEEQGHLEIQEASEQHNRSVPGLSGDQLITYRTAVATDSLYSQFHGPAKADILAAVVTIMNQSNAVTERELSVHMNLVANNDTVFFNSTTTADPYSNGFTDIMANENRAVLDQYIGNSNYDLGHVFGQLPFPYSVGNGWIRATCNNTFKGWGCSATFSPQGDGFLRPAVLHELGHQFGGTHIHNTSSAPCNRDGSTPFEPGSGTTLLAYSGASCGNSINIIQGQSDLYYNNSNLLQHYNNTRFGIGATCPVITSTSNTPPEAFILDSTGLFIPIETPFTLHGSGFDADGDALTYCWEQRDYGPAGLPDAPVGNAAIIRSRPPSTDPNRTIPSIINVINGFTPVGELLPTYSRDLSFRFTVRDNASGNGGVAGDEVSFRATEEAGPFLVTSPNTAGITWTVGSFETVTWDVANTDQMPVNCQEVDILLSTDGGFTYPHILHSNIPNNGSYTLVVPDFPSNTCRIRVQASENIFFDISNQSFVIEQSSVPDFDILFENTEGSVCLGDSGSYTILTRSLLGLADSFQFNLIGLPFTDFSFSYSPSPAFPGDTVTLFIAANSNAAPDTSYDVAFGIIAGGQNETEFLDLEVLSGIPASGTGSIPQNGEIHASTLPTFIWELNESAQSYFLEVATSPEFGNTLVYSNESILETSITIPIELSPSTPYYWRVSANNFCGKGNPSPVYGFRTGNCQTYSSTLPPIEIPILGFPNIITSPITVTDNFLLADVNVLHILGDHEGFNELKIDLVSPGGQTTSLMDNPCLNEELDFDFSFDDESRDSFYCPPTDGQASKPITNLSVYDGVNTFGFWELQVTDEFNFSGGTLDTWSLELCRQDELVLSLENQPMGIPRGNTNPIDVANLFASDGSSSQDDLVYTIVGLPQHGELEKQGSLLNIGDTFTQTDISNQSITYTHDSLDVNPDFFRFAVQNQVGNWKGVETFNIAIWATSLEETVNGISWNVYPNPATQSVQIQAEGISQGDAELVIFNMQGQKIYQESLQPEAGQVIRQLDCSAWAKGLYLVEIQMTKAKLSQKLVVQ